MAFIFPPGIVSALKGIEVVPSIWKSILYGQVAIPAFSSRYRYGFNGKEDDDEVSGEGNIQDYGKRECDLRLGKFWSVDPIAAKYPELTPFQFASNTPIWAVDLDGLEAYYSSDGTFTGFGQIKGDNAPVIVVTYVPLQGKMAEVPGIFVRQETPLTFKGAPVKNFEFEQYAATVHNETFGSNDDEKQKIADAIYNKKEGIKKDYPGIEDASLQQILDKVAYGKDSHKQRMSAERANPPSGATIPGTVTKSNPKGIPLYKITEKNYQNYMNKDIKTRNDDTQMKSANKAVINSLLRDVGLRRDDKANGKSHWRGNGKTNDLK